MSDETPELDSAEESKLEEPAVEVEPATVVEEPATTVDETSSDDRLFSIVAIGLMLLLLICVALFLIADRRPPAGL